MIHKLLITLLFLSVLLSVPVLAQAPTTQQAHSTLTTILERREFGSLQKDYSSIKAPSWWDNFTKSLADNWKKVSGWMGNQFSRLGAWWSQHFPKSDGKGNGFWNWWANSLPAIRYLLLGVLYLSAATLLGFIVYRIFLWTQTRQVIASLLGNGESLVGEKPTPLPTDWERAQREIEEMWNNGDQRGALRMLLRACQAILDMRGIMQYDNSRANGEVLRDLRRRGRQDLSDLLRLVVRPCDRVWYGGFSIESSEFINAVEAGKHLREKLLSDKVL